MSEWITDRRPTVEDSPYGKVWVTQFGAVLLTDWHNVGNCEPWMIMIPPEPYVKPKRFAIRCYGDFGLVGPAGYWCVYDTAMNVSVSDFMPFEAAERIAAIYEEVMP